jgi:hypothetical protein
MKVAHWTMMNGSGMFRMAESFVKAEKSLGIDSCLCDFSDATKFPEMYDADIHVNHTHIPDNVRDNVTKEFKAVWIGHGSVEHAFQSSVEAGLNKGYGASDGWMLCQYWLQNADAVVTFWPRQAAIWQSLCDKNTKVHCIPMGVEKDFWKPVESFGRYMGNPSLFTGENCHYVKWPFDLFVAWPWVYPKVPDSWLHAVYLPHDQARWWYPFINRNGCSFRTISSSMVLSRDNLRNAFCSVDYFIGLVRYGDFNRLSLEAAACGVKTISYCGNPYADYWLHEGDQRTIADELVEILKGNVVPRDKETVPDMIETAKAMIAVYESIL